MTKIPPSTLGKRVQDAREWRGLGQAELALRMRKSRPTISNWERGATAPTYGEIRTLAEVLDVDIDWLEGNDSTSVTHRYQRFATMRLVEAVAA